MSILGTRVVRLEDPLFLTSGATYTEDLVDDRLAGAVHAVFVRSPLAHAEVGAVDTSAALAEPGVIAVLTNADLALPAPRSRFREGVVESVMATDRVRFVGQPVALVLAENRYAAADAAELVSVDYAPLPAVVDPREAARDEVVLFPAAGTNIVAASGDEGDPHLLDGCPVVISAEIVNQRVAPAPLEGRAAAAAWGPDGRLTFWCPNQGAQGTKAALARALGTPADDVRVITPDVGGAFGAKFGVDPEHIAVAAAARTIGRPVRWVETRSENLTAMTHGRGQVQHVTIGGDRDGRMTAYRLDVLQDCGAYARIGVILPSLTALMAPGVYAFDRIEVRTRSVLTTTTPMGAYRGAGRPEAAAALERAVDLFAAEIGMDPAEVRRRNMLPAFDEPHTTATGAVYDVGDYPAALEKVLQAADYAGLRAEQARRRAAGETTALGIGLAVYVEITGGGDESGPPSENATVEVHPDGTATILTGTSPHGQGHATVWAMLASEELGIPIEKITVKWGDTDLVPQGGGTGGSRSLQQGGAAVRAAALDLIEVAKQRAAAVLEADTSDLAVDTVRAGIGVAGVPGSFVSFADLAADERLVVRAVFSAPGATFPFGAHLAVVDVDTESGKVTLRRLVAVDDSGTIINPLIADGQRHGGLAQGAAQALLEEVLFDGDGNPLTASFADYPIVTATEVPSFEVVPMETPTPYNPLGAKGIGESGTIGSTPAVQNAVVDALAHLGVRHVDMPTSPQRVWRAINAAVPATAAAGE
jgi:carbon-monoxide dehydrogenase large subunit